MDKVKVGIIGIGNMGSAHAANINKGKVPNMELAALCDIAEGRREYCKRNYPNVPVFKTSDELIESGLADAVIIATPHYFHPPIAIQAFDTG